MRGITSLPRFKFFILCFLILNLYLVGCQKHDETTKSVGKVYLNPKEALNVIEDEESKHIQSAGRTLIAKQAQNDTSLEEFKKLAKKFSELSKDDEHALGYWNIYEIKSQPNFKRNRLGYVPLFLKTLKIGIDYSDTLLMLFAVNDVSISYLSNGYLDSGLFYTKMGFDLAKYSREDVFIQNLGNNLGYIYNQLGMSKTAQAYFEQSYHASLQQKVPAKMALNNLISLLIDEGDIVQAVSLWNGGFSSYEFDFKKYEDQIYILQRSLLYIREDKYDSARIWLNKISTPMPVGSLEMNFLMVKTKLNLIQNISNNDILLEYKPRIVENSIFTLSKMSEVIAGKEVINGDIFQLSDFDSMELNLDSQSIVYFKAKSVLYNLKATKLSSMGNLAQAILAFNLANFYLDKYNDKLLSVASSDLSETMRLENLNASIKANSKLLAEKKAEASQYQIISFTLFIFAFLITLLIFRERRNHQLQKNVMQSQLDVEKKSAENLQLENEMNGRILALSKFMVSKSERINKLLMQVNETNYKEQFKEIKAEAISIQNAFTDAKPQLADKLLEDYEEIEKLFPLASELSLTEKRIFALSLNEYQSKEIGNILGLTAQYVNNTRTRIRKKLNLQDNWGEINRVIKNQG